jgi:hypothetical protein
MSYTSFLPEKFRKSPLYKSIASQYKYVLWLISGQPAPPPHVIKVKWVKRLAKQYQIKTLIETGTYLGDMIQAVYKVFDFVFSIELSRRLFELASERFKDNGNIKILHGDSGKILGKLLQNISTPCLFWLDGHYSEGITVKAEEYDTPIIRELGAILAHSHAQHHVIMIDDARCFIGQGDYPTIDQINVIADQSHTVSIKDDIIFLLPVITSELL